MLGAVPPVVPPVKTTVTGASPLVGAAVAVAVGSGFTVMATVALELRPAASRTVSWAVYWAAAV